MYYVYVICSLTRKYIYVGITNNVERRVSEHQSGINKTTRAYIPYKVVLTEEFNTRVAAREREKYLKSGVGKEFLKKILNNKGDRTQ